MFDSHCHLYSSDSLNALTESQELRQQPATHQIKHLCVLGTKPSDWELVEKALTEVQGKPVLITPGFGVHPWFVSEVTDIGETTERLKGLLLKHPEALIGEVGVDALKSVSFAAPISILATHRINEVLIHISVKEDSENLVSVFDL